ncbi:MAG: sigma-70 family RNA polymerase sigma factor [Phycisphaerales bacterium]|nr:sigma-70 family RNA polymerase sigma factor [Phycisphaerales bacterium]MCB9862315.1 sigma-70 family RNA polymerase sigma factor [Phycisphaerales bacterium]
MSSQEESHIAKAVAGDEESLATLLHQAAPQLRAKLGASISAKWQSVLDVDDVLQVTYLEAFLRIGRFEYKGPGSFAGWVSRIAENNLRDAIRELERLKRPQPQDRVTRGAGDESSFALLEGLGFTTTTPSRHVAHGEVKHAIAEALSRIPQDYATVVRLYDLEGLSAAEVAAKMQRSTGAVYMLRSRAFDCLRESFASESRLFSRLA